MSTYWPPACSRFRRSLSWRTSRAALYRSDSGRGDDDALHRDRARPELRDQRLEVGVERGEPVGLADALELDAGALEVDGKTVQTIHAELNQFLQEAEQALKDGDIILLADLLEYELAPRAELEVSIVSLLQAHIPARAE